MHWHLDFGYRRRGLTLLLEHHDALSSPPMPWRHVIDDGNQIVPSSAWATGDLQVSRPWRRRWLLFRDVSMPRRPTTAANAMRESSSKRESPGRVTDQLASLDNPGRVLDVTWVVGKLGIIVCPLCCWFLELIHACVLHLHSGYANNGPGSWLWSTCTCLSLVSEPNSFKPLCAVKVQCGQCWMLPSDHGGVSVARPSPRTTNHPCTPSRISGCLSRHPRRSTAQSNPT